MRWILGRHGWMLPLLTFGLVIFALLVIDRDRRAEVAAARATAEEEAGRRAGVLSEAVNSTISRRIGALAAARLRFTPVTDSVGEATFAAAVDSVTSSLTGLTAISVIDSLGEVTVGSGAMIGRRGLNLRTDTALASAYARALQSRTTAATGVLDVPGGRRVILFEPVVTADSASVRAVLAAELDPQAILRAATNEPPADTLNAPFYSIYGPNGIRINTVPAAPAEWPRVERSVSVADTEWRISLAYQPVSPSVYQATRVATWVTGLAVGVALTAILFFLRRTVATQREEIARREAAESEARRAAQEARDRAREARELATQLEAAQRAAERLSTSFDPDDVVELFLGGVAESLDADVASLYTFEEEGEVVVGRKRMVFRDAGPVTDRLKSEDIRQVRAPAAMLPLLAETVASGEPTVIQDARREGPSVSGIGGGGPESASASVTIPLLVGGHMVGIASWEVFTGPREFEAGQVAFAQALAAPAAAALRAAELFASLKAARERASREAVRFGTVLDQMADGVVVVDGGGRVELSNKAAQELLGLGLEDVPVRQWTQIFHIETVDGRSYPSTEFPLVRALQGHRVDRANFILRSSTGTERYLSGSAAPIRTASGDTTGAAMVFRDVTDEHQYAEMLRHTNKELRKQAEQLERMNQQLREATAAKDQFLAVMSHELRTPINAVMGYSDLLDLGVKGDLNAEQRAMLARIRDTSRHLLGLINEVLDLAKIGAGQIDLDLVELDLCGVVERAASQVLPLANAKGLQLKVGTEDPEGPLLVRADETRLTQIIINLLSNAVKFTPEGRVDVTIARHRDQALVRVRDTGPGIPPDQLDRIFEEFYQVDSGLARSSGGTGLGLAIARRFSRLMGGDVRVRSQLGDGAEFTIELPAVGAPAGDAGAEAGSAVALVAESHAYDAIAAELGPRLRLMRAETPSQVVEAVQRDGPGLIILDALAADLAAWRALGELLAERQYANRTLVLLAPRPERPDSTVDLGYFRLLPRPFRVEDLLQSLGGNAARPAARVLLFESDPAGRRLLADSAAATGVQVELAEGLDSLVAGDPPAAVLCDLMSETADCFQILARIRSSQALRRTPVIVTAPESLEAGQMEALRERLLRVVRTGPGEVRAIAAVVAEAAGAEDASFAATGT